MSKSLLRYSVVRKGDTIDDQKTAAEILAAETSSVTQEDLQSFSLSQIKRIIFGNDPGNWNDDFAVDIDSLKELTSKIDFHRLIYFIDHGPAEDFASGAYKEVTGTLFPTNVTWWTSSAKTIKIVEKIITRSGGSATNLTPTPIVWKAYDAAGVLTITATDDITYSGIYETSRVRTITV